MKTLLWMVPILLAISVSAVHAQQSNPNLYVSAESLKFDNHFAGSMVIEVVVTDRTISGISETQGEPDVTVNGFDLRMAQARDGNWYGYFANVDNARAADDIASAGVPGQGLDFGRFCSPNTNSTVIGIDISDTDGVAVPRIGLDGDSDGGESMNTCSGTLQSGSSINNVVRNAKSLNTNTGSGGQIGLDRNAWPLVQLYSFSNDVKIKYNRGGDPQQVILHYDDIPNISLELDREKYPSGAEVILKLNDVQLNQDPTDDDSWTFSTTSPATFYAAFDDGGRNAANGGAGLINLVPALSRLGFNDNGVLMLDSNPVVNLKTNRNQPVSSVTDGTITYSNIVTLLESESNSGVFLSYGSSNESVIGIHDGAPRGRAGIISYNDHRYTILTGSSSGAISLDDDKPVVPGRRTPVQIADSDQDINTSRRDVLDVSRSSAIIPTLQIGTPITLESASSVVFYRSSSDDLTTDGTLAPSSVPDRNSDRLIIDTNQAFSTDYRFAMMSIDLGVSASTLQDLFIDTRESGTRGTNWVNFDMRSFEQQLGVRVFSSASMSLYFGLDDDSPVQIIDAGDIGSAQDLLRIDDEDVEAIHSKSGRVFLVIDFGGEGGIISNESDTQPIVFDLFSFGQAASDMVNNAIYRFELEETGPRTGVFAGTMEYSVTNQLNLADPELVESLRTISDDVRFLINGRLLDEMGINISYSDVGITGTPTPQSTKSDIPTHSGTVGFDSDSYRFGQPVKVELYDPDLNLNSDAVEIYRTINNPDSPFVDTVSDAGGNWLLEILIKDIRYKRCTINGVTHGGLGSVGFSLVETGPATGRFVGTFKMPSQICNADGTRLISPAGGSINARYNDFRDGSGSASIFETGRNSIPTSDPSLNAREFVVPSIGQTSQVILDGKISDYRRGIPVEITVIEPDGSQENLGIFATSQGSYRMISNLNSDTALGTYIIHVEYQGVRVGTLTFDVISPQIPSWIKNTAGWWAQDKIPTSEFIRGLEYLIQAGIIQIPVGDVTPVQDRMVPDWVKNTAGWWSENLITDGDFMSSLEYLISRGIIRV